MANQIIDNRTLLIANEAADADLDDLTGSADTGGDNTEVFIEGSASRSFKVSQAVDGRLYDAGSAQDWSNNHFYIWARCTSTTDTLANGGVRVRFCGATVTDWFEKYVFGGNIGTIAGWEMIVIDIEKARADAVGGTNGGTNGTTPATSAIRYVGVVFDVPGMVAGNTDNCFIDAMWRLSSNTPGIIVEGQDQTVSAHDWNWQDIVDAGDVTDTSKAWGTVVKKDGVIKINTPIRFGTNDATTHGFSDTNVVVAWQDNLVADDFYELDIIGGSGTQSWGMGVKTGTGDDATGAQGMVILAESSGVRYNINANDANLDAANFYGCQFFHGGTFLFNDVATSVISPLFNDCTSVTIDNALDFQKGTVVNSNTGDGVAFIKTDNLAEIRDFTFEFSDGHAIERTGAVSGSENLVGCVFNNYGADATNDAALYFSGTGTMTVNVDNATTERSPSATITIVQAPVTIDVHVDDNTGSALQNARVWMAASNGTGPLPFEESVTSITRASTTATVTHTAHGLVTNDYVKLQGITDKVEDNNGAHQVTVTGANTYTYQTTDSGSTNYTGTITATGGLIYGLTDASGDISRSRSFGSNQPITGNIRKSTSSPRFKTFNLAGNTVSSTTGLTVNVRLQLDE